MIGIMIAPWDRMNGIVRCVRSNGVKTVDGGICDLRPPVSNAGGLFIINLKTIGFRQSGMQLSVSLNDFGG